MTRKDLARKVYDAAYITGRFVLRSGAISSEYFDKYRFESDPALLRAICEAALDILPSDFDVLAGLEMGGIPLAVELSQLTSKPACFVRKKPKEYGTRQLAEGLDVEGKKLLVVEDVVTSGGQIVLSVKDLRERGAIIEKAFCVIDRESSGKDNLAKIGVELTPLFTMSELKEAAAAT